MLRQKMHATSAFYFAALIAAVSALPVPNAEAQSTPPDRVDVQLLSPLPHGVAGHAAGMIGDNLVSVGGTSWTEDKLTKTWHDDCFVKIGDSWTRGPSLPHPRADSASAYNTRGLYIVGGTDRMTESSDVYFLPSIKGPWQKQTSLPIPIQGASAVFIDAALIVIGGKSQNRPQFQTWVMDHANSDLDWRSGAAFPGPGRSHSALFVINRSVYLFGGFILDDAGNLQIFDDAYRYDLKQDQWEKLEHIRIPGYAWAIRAINDTKLLVVGRVRARGDIRTDVELIDLGDGSIRTIGHLKVPTCVTPLIHIGGRRWAVFGGEPNPNRNRNDAVQLLTYDDRPK